MSYPTRSTRYEVEFLDIAERIQNNREPLVITCDTESEAHVLRRKLYAFRGTMEKEHNYSYPRFIALEARVKGNVLTLMSKDDTEWAKLMRNALEEDRAKLQGKTE